MANLKDIRDQIKSVKSIQKVTKAMKMVAAAKMRRAQDNMEKARPYASKLFEIINNLKSDIISLDLPLTETREVKRIAFVVITSDKGLAGSFNSSVLKKAQQEIDALDNIDVDVFCIGKKSSDFFKARNYNVILNESEFWNHLDFSTASTISKNITDHFLNKKVDQIRVVFNEFVNVATQKVIVKTLLPLEFKEDPELLQNTDLLYEPSKEEIVEHLTPKHVKVQVWRFLLESFASEQAARMVAMENATSNSEEMIKDLTLKFNKARQAAITTEMLEIVGGAEALKG